MSDDVLVLSRLGRMLAERGNAHDLDVSLDVALELNNLCASGCSRAKKWGRGRNILRFNF